MKKYLLLLLLSATFTTAAHASGIVLPDSCGDDKIKFDVDLKKDQPAPAALEEGKARIVLVDDFAKGVPTMGKFGIVRFGIDGKWVGAATDNSYFVVDVPAGEHHLCSAIQAKFTMPKNFQKSNIGMTSFTAEAGKTYYFEYKISQAVIRGGGGTAASYSTDFGPLDEDNGKFRVKASKVSVSTVKKDEDSSEGK